MADRRLIPANGRVAARHLKGQAEAAQFVDGQVQQVVVAVANLWADEHRQSVDRQLLFGDQFLTLETVGDMAFGQSLKDGYVGYLSAENLIDPTKTTHFISVRSAYLYPVPDFKSVPMARLSFGGKIRVIGTAGDYLETDGSGFIYRAHAQALQQPMDDPASVCELFLGTPYLWGGNSCDGIDCSGLVQVALLSCGVECPGDSDLQQTSVGVEFGDNTPVQRNDLLFWKGHVAMALDADHLIHATAFGMVVRIEKMETVIQRIAEQGEGPVLSRRRPRL